MRFDQTFVLPPLDALDNPPILPLVLNAVASINPTQLPEPLHSGYIYDDFVLHSTVAVTFTYTPTASVPEPASWALLLAGGIGVFGVARRKRGVAAN